MWSVGIFYEYDQDGEFWNMPRLFPKRAGEFYIICRGNEECYLWVQNPAIRLLFTWQPTVSVSERRVSAALAL